MGVKVGLRNVPARLVEDGFQRAFGHRSGKGNDERFFSVDHRPAQLDVITLLADHEKPEPFEDCQYVVTGENLKLHSHTEWLEAWSAIRNSPGSTATA